MAILSESNWLENKLKEALIKNGIQFEEQKRIYEKGDHFHPKYVVDFYLTNGANDLIVECDGFSFHSSDKDVAYGIERDRWLKSRGYKNIIHFTSNQIKYESDTVLAVIKNKLGIAKADKNETKFRGKTRRTKPVINIKNSNLHDVELFYQFITDGDKVYVTYKFRDNTLRKASEERIVNVCNAPTERAGDVALLAALKDLKKSVTLTVYCHSEWLTNYFNGVILRSNAAPLLTKLNDLLRNHNYIFKYLNTTRAADYYFNPQDERLICRELYSRCRQQRYTDKTNDFIDYNLLIADGETQ
ncbi:MAG: endonuclease domain-containing protein [Firmicutes bacterium]|nr:endonuclease domain-containing protein [Bacillota bacterium]